MTVVGVDASGDPGKAPAAMLAIGELAERIGVPTHVLRYWETRFPQLKPLQRSGRRRYYRAEDVALAERIHHLLHVQGFTVEGARKALSERGAKAAAVGVPVSASGNEASRETAGVPVEALVALRRRLVAALG
jgi:DNA-binding transcriptional MerR regulator